MSGPKRLSLRAGVALAGTTFDTSTFPFDAIRLDAYCELNGIPLRFRPYVWSPHRSAGSGDVPPGASRPKRKADPDHVRLFGSPSMGNSYTYARPDHVETPPRLPVQWVVDVYATEPIGASGAKDPFMGHAVRNAVNERGSVGRPDISG